MGNSDQVKVGEWVMAVGNPFNLTTTVTTGIVSAKARNLQMSDSQFAIESFIQTDAVVNPGNSGGALVNIRGELVGINTAIASPTGVYAGYSFAVPVNIVQKVVRDIMEYGFVKRGFLGISIGEINSQMARELGMNKIEGVFVSQVAKGGAAYDAGIRPGDIITEVEGIKINSSPELQEMVSQRRPGDNVNITYRRKGTKPKSVNVRLKQGF